MPKDDEVKFPSTMQTAIFSFVMSLISQYKETMAPLDAVCKAADWLRSLADKLESGAHAYADDANKKFEETNIGEDEVAK